MISIFCNSNGLYYIDNRNTKADCLYKDNLHLLDNEKILIPCISANQYLGHNLGYKQKI